MPAVNLLHVHSSSIGYGRLGVHLADQLTRLGIDVYDHLPGPSDPVGAHLNGRYRSGVAPVVAWVSVPTHARGWWRGQTPVIFTMWEATRLPEAFRKNLHEFDTVVVPSAQNLELFGQFHDNVHYVPLGVDPDRWRYVARADPGQWFTFLCGGSGPRKGTDLAYEAFGKAFPDGSWGDGPIPRLVLKNPRGEDFPHHDRVVMVAGKLDDDEETALYASAHCYIQPSRGEGFGLQPLQAIAQGCPTILTDAHGHAGFAHLGWGISATPARSGYFIFGDAGDWWEPSLDELVDVMRWVYDNYGYARTRAAHSSTLALTEFSWRRTAERFVDAVGKERFETDPPAMTDWFEPTSKRFLVVTTRDWPADIGGISYFFRRGERYYEIADVKRVLFEAGLLDPSCLTGEHESGLTPEQVVRVAAYSASREHCPTCGQRMGTSPTRADELLAEAEAMP